MEKSPFQDKNVEKGKFLNALAEAFRLQEAIINAIDHPIIATTSEGIINCFNKSAEDLIGYQGDELLGKANALMFFDLEDVIRKTDELSKQLEIRSEPVFEVLTYKSRQRKKSDSYEMTMVTKDGTKFPVQISTTALRDDQGNVMGFVNLITDLRQQRKQDQESAINEQKFRLLAENIPGAIYLCHNDATYSMIYLNDRIVDITGYKAAEFLSGSINFLKLYHPEDTERILKTVDNALEAKRRYHLKYRIRHKSGEWRWIEEVGVGVYDEDKLLMLEGFISDITTQKLAEEKLQKAAEENLRVFDNPVHLNVVAGFDGYFKRVSSSWTMLLGWTEEELKTQPFISFIHPDDLESTKDAITYITAGNNLYTFENRYRGKDGSYKWLLWGSATDVDQKVIYASAIDITERKKSEEKLIQSKRSLEAIALKLQEQNRQLDEFAHIISHNLRSPVGNIQALISLLDDNSTVDDYKLIFDKLKNVAKNLGETMNDLMDTMKVKTNTNIEKVDVRFKEILDKVVQSLEGDLIKAEASVTFDFNDATTVLYPKAYIESIFQNLLSNAIKYRSPERKPTIHFQTKKLKNFIELTVSDNGLGIDLQKYGDKLFGLHKTFHEHSEARGVGLFLIKTQIEAMGGSISAKSKVGEGTTFTIRFSDH
jgi:PAS domain S-box-containing protein